ncbi:hypothetical protein [Okeania sp. SIO3I5]|uniref:hypothetical protein n=1 Tax=Okeania sp. SIO3I5 TaxID=2607805 RepID=UPI0025F28953|nr:hypothetical protein [Okeania sp. SIO3I5]
MKAAQRYLERMQRDDQLRIIKALDTLVADATGLDIDILPTLPLRDNAGFFSLGNPDRCLDRGDVLPLC